MPTKHGEHRRPTPKACGSTIRPLPSAMRSKPTKLGLWIASQIVSTALPMMTASLWRYSDSASFRDRVLSESRLVMSRWRTSIGNSVRRAGSSSLRRPRCHFALQHGPAPNIAHGFFASSESPLVRVGTCAVSSASAELQTGAQSQLTFCCFASFTL
jgi:hypothetical protein